VTEDPDAFAHQTRAERPRFYLSRRAARWRSRARNRFFGNRVGGVENREKNLRRTDFRFQKRCAPGSADAQFAIYVTSPAEAGLSARGGAIGAGHRLQWTGIAFSVLVN
jgi:hypothetical protein